jgi:hypothetical protein
LRIALFAETFLPATDGIVTRLRYTIKELRGMGDELLIIAPAYGEGPGFYEGFPIYRVSSVPFPPYPQIKLAPALPGVGHALMGFKPDLIHAVTRLSSDGVHPTMPAAYVSRWLLRTTPTSRNTPIFTNSGS